MKAGAALVLTDDPRRAAREAVEQARTALGEEPPAFAVLFASQHFHVSAQVLLAAVSEQLGSLPLIGGVAVSVPSVPVGAESEAAVSLWLAADVGPVETFAMEFVRTSSGGAFGGYRFEPDRQGGCLLGRRPFPVPCGH